MRVHADQQGTSNKLDPVCFGGGGGVTAWIYIEGHPSEWLGERIGIHGVARVAWGYGLIAHWCRSPLNGFYQKGPLLEAV